MPRRPEQQGTRVFESDLSPNAELPNSVKRPATGNEDDEEVILLTPKPRFEFKDLQFERIMKAAEKRKNRDFCKTDTPYNRLCPFFYVSRLRLMG